MNKLPFPKIDPHVFDREGLKECYVFKPKDPASDVNCPTIIHFVLANINFRKFKAPGELPKAPPPIIMDYSEIQIAFKQKSV